MVSDAGSRPTSTINERTVSVTALVGPDFRLVEHGDAAAFAAFSRTVLAPIDNTSALLERSDLCTGHVLGQLRWLTPNTAHTTNSSAKKR